MRLAFTRLTAWESFLSRMVTFALVLVAAFSGFSVSAQEPKLAIEEIVVVARKREEAAQQVPISISVLTAELKESTIRNLSDINSFAANVNVNEVFARSRGTTLNIRGVSYTAGDKSLDPPIGVVLDGIHIGAGSGYAIENFDLERIEILRGPQGTLFGKNTVGGLINVQRTKPTGHFDSKVRLTYGRWGQKEFRAVINLPKAKNIVSTKLFYTNIGGDGHLKNTTLGGRAQKRDYSNYGVSLAFDNEKSFDATLTLERFNDVSDTAAAVNGNRPGFVVCDVFESCGTNARDERYVTSNTDNDGNFETDAISLTANWDASENIRLVSVTGWRNEIEDRLTDLDGALLQFVDADVDETHKQFSTELRIEAEFDALTLVAGAFYWENQYTQDWITRGRFWQFLAGGLTNNQDSGVPFPALGVDLPGTAGLTDLCLLELLGSLRCDQDVGLGSAGLGENFVQKLAQSQKTRSHALFLHADYALTQRWILAAGLRWTEERKDFIGAQGYLAPAAREAIDNFVNFAGEPDIADLSDRWRRLSPKLSLRFQASEHLMLYASFSQGFHSGGYFGGNQNRDDFANAYDPEVAKTYELGLKSKWFDQRLQMNVTAFLNQFENKQENSIKADASNSTVVSVVDNVGEAKYLGMELELQWLATQRLSFFANLGLLDAKYKNFCIDVDGPSVETNPVSDCGDVERAGTSIAGDPLFIVPRDRTDLTPRLAPEWTFGTGLSYTLALGPGQLNASARFNVIGKQQCCLDNGGELGDGEIDPVRHVNASLSYNWNRFRVAGYGRNLTNEIMFGGINVGNLFRSGFRGPGRSWGLELEWEFGEP